MRKNSLIAIAGSTLFSLIIYLVSSVVPAMEKEVGLLSILALGFVFLLTVASVLFSIYYSVRILGYSLQRLGYETREFGWGIKVSLAGFGQALASLVLWMDKKLMIIFGAAFAILAALGLVLAVMQNWLGLSLVAVVGLLVALPYFIFGIYHSMRLYFTSILFLCGKPFAQSLQDSWDMTAGRILRIFGAGFIAGIAIFAVLALPSILIEILASLTELGAGNLSPLLYLLSALIRIPGWLISGAATVAFQYYLVGMFHAVASEVTPAAEIAPTKMAASALARKKR